jgi:hypothetical protein
LLLCLIMVLGLAVPSVQAAESSSGNIMDGVYIDGDSGANIVIDGAVSSEQACGPNIIAVMEVALGVFGASGKLPVNICQYDDGNYTQTVVYPRGFGLEYDEILPD